MFYYGYFLLFIPHTVLTFSRVQLYIHQCLLLFTFIHDSLLYDSQRMTSTLFMIRLFAGNCDLSGPFAKELREWRAYCFCVIRDAFSLHYHSPLPVVVLTLTVTADPCLSHSCSANPTSTHVKSSYHYCITTYTLMLHFHPPFPLYFIVFSISILLFP